MTTVAAAAIAALWEDTLRRSALPPRVAGVTSAEYDLARLVQADPRHRHARGRDVDLVRPPPP